jgi:hypothetical protein
VKDFFKGFSWCLSIAEVYEAVRAFATNRPMSQKKKVEPEVKYCASCGARNGKNIRFCGNCGGQVFVETKDNEYFLPWSDLEMVIATDNFARRVRLAIALIDVSRRSIDGGYVPSESEVHFLPLEEELIGVVRKFGLEAKLSVEWRYIQAQPKDAFKQILGKGYIRTLLDEKGKRIKREKADDLYKE